ncbi:hypothetical protein [Pedobacter sp. KLB.chiD]|uniref:hypothetical protein n=1 Tax=Pedobacter sp. KLB.chiD TaxID=3387402 RepID=UPI003999643D
MKKLIIMTAFAFFATASLTSSEVQAKEKGQIYIDDQGCYYEVVTHTILWGLITWDSEPRLIGCGSGFA